MLLDGPLTPFILEASRYEDEIRRRLIEIRTVPNVERDRLLGEILQGPLAELRRLLHERFEDRPGIRHKLDAIEGAVRAKISTDEIWWAFRALEELSEDTFGTGFI